MTAPGACKACGREQWVGGRIHDCRPNTGGGLSAGDVVRSRETGDEVGVVLELRRALSGGDYWDASVRPAGAFREQWWPVSALEVIEDKEAS